MIDYNSFRHALTSVYDTGEANAIARLVYEKCCSLSLADIYACKDTQLSAETYEVLQKTLERLLLHEPVQYVLGEAEFCGRRFSVNRNVLIPRPETEELCRLVKASEGMRILDACTGSGCIAITLALDIKGSQVCAFDISQPALDVAQQNAKALGANVNFYVADALSLDDVNDKFDAIVSNPPYICEREKAEMNANVLDYEPSGALFVSDENPIVFYRAITDFASRNLKLNGKLYFEVNPKFADEIGKYISCKGFATVNIHLDSFGKKRFIEAQL